MVQSFHVPTLPRTQPTRSAAGPAEKVVLGRRAQEPLPTSLDQVRQSVARLDFLPIDPFVASVGAVSSADQMKLPKGEVPVGVAAPDFYAKDVNVLLGAQNGPDRPMLLILPGVSSNGDSSHNQLLKRMALERGMNYVVLPNSFGSSMLDELPRFHPGNPRLDALVTRQVVSSLKEQYPEYFSRISVAGYSFGALQGANLIRLDEEGPDRLINGGLVAFSPPENLEHSMHQLDGLREFYPDVNSTMANTALEYRHDVRTYGYECFMACPLAEHGRGTNVDEIDIADTYGSRNGLKNMIEEMDKQFERKLPKNTDEYKRANPVQKINMSQEHQDIVDNITYAQYSSGWMSKDSWLQEQDLTPEQMATRYSFSNAMQAITRTPVLVLTAADDYILTPEDVAQMRKLEANPGLLEVAKVFSTGGHVGLDWNPQITQTAIDFAAAAPDLKN